MKDDTTTLYLRGVSRSVVRQLKTEAARRGQPLGRVVSDVVAQSLGSASTHDDLAADIAYFERNRSALARRFPAQHGARSILIRRTASEGPLRLRSPRLRRS
jgi:hypothetical protein